MVLAFCGYCVVMLIYSNVLMGGIKTIAGKRTIARVEIGQWVRHNSLVISKWVRCPYL